MRAAPSLGGLLGFATTIYLFYPGFMVWDSTWQLQQAVTGDVNNAHPPIMVYLWALTNRVVYGPAGMLVLQAAGYWGGVVLIARHAARSPGVRLALVLGLGFFPPLIGTLPTIWKDSGSLAALLMAGGLMLEADRRRRRTAAMLAIPFTFYALAVRFNNVLTVLPLLWWISRLVGDRRSSTAVERRPIAVQLGTFLALFAAMVSLAYAINTLGVRKYSYFVAVPLWDLAQISLRTNQMLVPDVAVTSGTLDMARLRKISRPYRCDYARVRRDGEIAQDIEWHHLTGPEARQVLRHWVAAIARHPLAYLDHRLNVARAAVLAPHFGQSGRGASRRIFGAQRLVSIEGFSLPFAFSPRPGYGTVQRVLTWSAESVLCRPWLYAAIALAVWLIAWWRRSDEDRMARAFASSGLLSVAPLVVIAPSTDFRYAIWLVASAIIGLVLVVSREVRARGRGGDRIRPFGRSTRDPGRASAASGR